MHAQMLLVRGSSCRLSAYSKEGRDLGDDLVDDEEFAGLVGFGGFGGFGGRGMGSEGEEEGDGESEGQGPAHGTRRIPRIPSHFRAGTRRAR